MKRTGTSGICLSRRDFIMGSGAAALGGAMAACSGADGPGSRIEGRAAGGSRAAGSAGTSASRVSITEQGSIRRVRSNGIPDHLTGAFPNAHCPFGVRPQRYDFTMPAEPEEAPSFTAIEMWIFGVAINGVPFDPAGPYYQRYDANWHFEVTSPMARPYLGLDAAHAHTQMGGAYHYHGLPDRFRPEGSELSMLLAGWAADGFPIYAPLAPADPLDPESPLAAPQSSYRLRAAYRESGPGGRCDGTFVQDYAFVPELGDLDQANGRFGVTPEFPEGTYHYFLTEQFPFVPRFYRGTPDPSFEHPHPPGTPVTGPLPPELWNYQGEG